MTDIKDGGLNAWQRWRMCGRKKSFETESKANKAARRINGTSYECPICFCWHVTKKNSAKGFADRLDAMLSARGGER